MNDYPRSRNGWVDDGERLKGAAQNQPCYNCGSKQYFQTVSREHCPACGLVVDYWGGGTNEVYLAYELRKHAEAEQRERDRERALRDEHEAQFNHWDDEC